MVQDTAIDTTADQYKVVYEILNCHFQWPWMIL